MVALYAIPPDVVEYELGMAQFDLEEPEGLIDDGEPTELFELAWRRIQTRHDEREKR